MSQYKPRRYSYVQICEHFPLSHKSGRLGLRPPITVSDLFSVFFSNSPAFYKQFFLCCSWSLNHAAERPENIESAQKRPHFAPFKGEGGVGGVPTSPPIKKELSQP